MRIAITGAGGKTGHAVARAVRAAGHEPIPVVRRPRGLPGERIAEFDDTDALASALRGIDAVYLIAPNVHRDEPGLLRPILERCQSSGVPVVYHSVMHPNARSMPHHLAKAEVEDAIHNSALTWTILQPASYMDNVLAPIVAATDGIWRQPFSVTTSFTPVALEDVGAAAAVVLADPSYAFGTYELAGPDRLSTEQMAALIGAHLDRPLDVVADRAAWLAGPASSLDEDTRLRLSLMFDSYDEHDFVGNSRVLAMLLRREPVSFAEWVLRHRGELAGG